MYDVRTRTDSKLSASMSIFQPTIIPEDIDFSGEAGSNIIQTATSSVPWILLFQFRVISVALHVCHQSVGRSPSLLLHLTVDEPHIALQRSSISKR